MPDRVRCSCDPLRELRQPNFLQSALLYCTAPAAHDKTEMLLHKLLRTLSNLPLAMVEAVY